MMHRLVCLACGHERWCPFDYDERRRLPLTCAVCASEQPVVTIGPLK